MYLYRHHPEAGLAPQRSWLVGKMCWPVGPEGSRRCRALGERASVAAGVDYEVYWTLRLNEQCCLMCSPTEKNEKQYSNILEIRPEKIEKPRYGTSVLPVSARCVYVVRSVSETSFRVTDLGCAPQSCIGTRQETGGGVVPWIALSRDCWSLCG